MGCRTSVDKEAGSGSRFPAGLGLGRDVWVTAGSWPDATPSSEEIDLGASVLGSLCFLGKIGSFQRDVVTEYPMSSRSKEL